ncbi:hypothetical protein UA08_00448, partial [Talaromyces atroroseus]
MYKLNDNIKAICMIALIMIKTVGIFLLCAVFIAHLTMMMMMMMIMLILLVDAPIGSDKLLSNSLL